MAKKKATRTPAAGKRYRRNDEELIADLKAKIKEVKARQEARKLKESPAIRSAYGALKAIDKGLSAAADEGNTKLRHALADARKPLEGFLTSEGMKLPKANLPRGRRPKDA